MARFYELSRYDSMILSTKYERICYFVRGRRLSLHMATQSLVVGGRLVMDIF